MHFARNMYILINIKVITIYSLLHQLYGTMFRLAIYTLVHLFKYVKLHF